MNLEVYLWTSLEKSKGAVVFYEDMLFEEKHNRFFRMTQDSSLRSMLASKELKTAPIDRGLDVGNRFLSWIVEARDYATTFIDFHREKAAEHFGVDYNDVTDEQRKFAKENFLGSAYALNGVSPEGFSKLVSSLEKIRVPLDTSKSQGRLQMSLFDDSEVTEEPALTQQSDDEADVVYVMQRSAQSGEVLDSFASTKPEILVNHLISLHKEVWLNIDSWLELTVYMNGEKTKFDSVSGRKVIQELGSFEEFIKAMSDKILNL